MEEIRSIFGNTKSFGVTGLSRNPSFSFLKILVYKNVEYSKFSFMLSELWNVLCFVSPLAFWFGRSVKSKEELVFYPSIAYQDPETLNWMIEIQGHVFEKKESSKLRKWIFSSLRKAFGIQKQSKEESIFKKQLYSFLVDNRRSKKVFISLKGKIFKMKKTRPNGKFRTVLTVPNDFLEKTEINEGSISFKAILKKGDSREIVGKIYLLNSYSQVLISDIDDTIKISNVRDKKKLLSNIFSKEPKSVEGMTTVYQKIHSAQKTLFCYISASPWQLYSNLSDFIQTNGFPEGIFVLKNFRWKDRNFFNLFKPPGKYKIKSIEPFLRKANTQKFILVGDSGEEDHIAFAELYRKYPNKIQKILIRNSYPEDPIEKIQNAFYSIPSEKWILFNQAQELDSYLNSL